MTERQRGLLLLGLGLLGCYAVFRAGGDTPFPALLLGVFVARIAIASYRAKEGRSALAQILAALRSQDRAGREAMLQKIPSARLRGYLEEVLRSDGSEEREGDVEQFPYPRSLQRRYVRWYWLTTTAGTIALIWASFSSDAAVVVRVIGIAVGLFAVWLAWWSSKQQRNYASVIEITPFRVTERAIDGSTRTLLFNRYLELHNDPKNKRAVLSPGGPDRGIMLDYRRMAFSRLAALVMEYGGFEPVEGGG